MLSGTRDRYEKIWRTVRAIPAGRVATYGQIADLAGLGRGARLVGRALQEAPEDDPVPWHRVINAAGKISFPAGSAAYRRQRSLLESEGVVFLRGKVNLARYRWDDALDALLWGEP